MRALFPLFDGFGKDSSMSLRASPNEADEDGRKIMAEKNPFRASNFSFNPVLAGIVTEKAIQRQDDGKLSWIRMRSIQKEYSEYK